MPSLTQNPSSDAFYARFRYRGRSYKRSLSSSKPIVSSIRAIADRAVVRSLTGADIQAYVRQRLKNKLQGKLIRSDTIKKELSTLRMIWNRAVRLKVLDGQAPIAGVQFPKREIQKHIAAAPPRPPRRCKH